ncbi:MAG: hypothetical protein LBQ54_11510 [Planctomycetaceae bacterium]|nr:hypothetical protein [Planctomycetaceae bacterium]
MKNRFFTTTVSALFMTLVMAFARAANADTVYLGTNNPEAWGTLYSDVESEAYFQHVYNRGSGFQVYNPSTGRYDDTITGGSLSADGKNVLGKTLINNNLSGSQARKVDTWEYRRDLLVDYLKNGLGSNPMDANSNNAGTTPNRGALATWEHAVQTVSDSSQAYGSLYGKGAHTIDAVGGALSDAIKNQMLPSREDTKILTSTAGRPANGANGGNYGNNWTYNPSSDKFTSGNGVTPSNGIEDQNTGIYAFVTGFSFNAADEANFIKGWFSVLGSFLGVYINGEYVDGSLLGLSSNYNNSWWFSTYDLNIDLSALYQAGILREGNNNIAFLIDNIPVEYLGSAYATDGGDGLLGFASGMYQEYTRNQTPNPGDPGTGAVPEPAGVLLWAFGSLSAMGISVFRKRRGTEMAV